MKSTLYLLLFTILFLSCSTTKQLEKDVNYIPYFSIVYECDSIYVAKDYEKVYKRLDSLFKKNTPVNTLREIDQFIKVAYLTKKNIKYKKYFKILVQEYGYDFNQDRREYMPDSLLKIIYKQKKISKKAHAKWLETYKNNISVELGEELTEMNKMDQKYRRKGVDFSIEKFDSIDDINEHKLIAIFNKYGYPSYRNTPIETKDGIINSLAHNLLLHTRDSIRISYFAPKILSYVKNGLCPPKIYAEMIDQYYIYNGEKQIYNSYAGDSVRDSIKARELRLQIGLPKSLTLNHWVFYQEIKNNYPPSRLRKRLLKHLAKTISNK